MRRPPPHPRALAAIAAGKVAAETSRRLGRGGGTALPGLVAERFDPGLIASVAAQLGHGCVVVTGTNGKTTTAGMLAAIARAAGLRVVHNRSGSNLMRGLATTLVEASGLHGRLPQASRSLGVFEIDEATLLHAAPALRPRTVVFTNLFRDQLDRYGEVDSILEIWRRSLAQLPSAGTIALNADDPSVASLAAASRSSPVFYGVEDRSHAAEAEHAADARWCARCGTEYRYSALYFGHIGLWSCAGCGAARPQPEVAAEYVDLEGPTTTHLAIRTPAGPLALTLALGGLYNAYNALAATAGAAALQLPAPAIEHGLRGFSAAFGRQERLQVRGRTVELLLCKNPAGVNQVLRALATRPGGQTLLLILNDGIADGRDVSWIWDVDYEQLHGRVRLAVACGRRGADLALRLKYAGLGDCTRLEGSIERGLQHALVETPVGETLIVLPTYTAMLAVRELLARMGGHRQFWQT